MIGDVDPLLRYSIPGKPRAVLSIGLGAKRVTFQSQQIRSLNLPYLLESVGRLKAGHKVAIVGAGLAGLTAAAAFGRRNCEVTVIESKDDAFSPFAKNRQRVVHPNLY